MRTLISLFLVGTLLTACSSATTSAIESKPTSETQTAKAVPAQKEPKQVPSQVIPVPPAGPRGAVVSSAFLLQNKMVCDNSQLVVEALHNIGERILGMWNTVLPDGDGGNTILHMLFVHPETKSMTVLALIDMNKPPAPYAQAGCVVNAGVDMHINKEIYDRFQNTPRVDSQNPEVLNQRGTESNSKRDVKRLSSGIFKYPVVFYQQTE
jgi:hypothetical protein